MESNGALSLENSDSFEELRDMLDSVEKESFGPRDKIKLLYVYENAMERRDGEIVEDSIELFEDIEGNQNNESLLGGIVSGSLSGITVGFLGTLSMRNLGIGVSYEPMIGISMIGGAAGSYIYSRNSYERRDMEDLAEDISGKQWFDDETEEMRRALWRDYGVDTY